jgi:hypothetical protein
MTEAPTSPRPDEHAWLDLSSRLHRVVETRSARTDLVVRASPDLRAEPAGWSGCYWHDLAEIRLPTGTLLDASTRPDDVDLLIETGRRRHPRLAAGLTLAVAHADHTRWTKPTDTDPLLTAALDLLERLRVSRRRLDERPGERRWLRIAASLLAPGCDSAILVALHTVGLAVAGVLSSEEAQIADRHLGEALASRAASVRAALRRGMDLPDGSPDDLRREAERLVALVGRAATGDGPDAEGDTDLDVGGAMRAALDDVARGESEPTRADRGRTAVASERDLLLAERGLARAAAASTFTAATVAAREVHRDPSPELRLAARSLARDIQRARYRGSTITLTRSAVPPGRLRAAEAMRRAAQRSVGARTTAQPWLRSRRAAVDLPPLRVGVSWDISRSLSGLHKQMADLAWALAWAVQHVAGELAAVAWNSTATAVQWPGRAPGMVVQPDCRGRSGACPQSLRALSGALDLDRARGARIVIVATDGRIPNRRAVRAEVERLVRWGTSVLWVTPAPDPHAPPGVLQVAVSDPDRLNATLGRAVCQILAKAES